MAVVVAVLPNILVDFICCIHMLGIVVYGDCVWYGAGARVFHSVAFSRPLGLFIPLRATVNERMCVCV